MTLLRIVAVGAILAASGGALADTDCSDPISAWKPRELLRQQVEQRGWSVQRIKVDDGCYEVRGTDRLGNKVKAKFGPATLRIRSLEVEFGPEGDASDYFRPARAGHGPAQPRGPATKGNYP